MTTIITNEDDQPRREYAAERPDTPSRANQILLLFAAAIISGVMTIAINAGGKFVAGGENSAVLTDRVQQILDVTKDHTRALQQILITNSSLYTRDEARADREATERRFQSMDTRFAELTRRLETLETVIRLIPPTQPRRQ